MRTVHALLLVLGVAVALTAVSGRRVSVSGGGSLEQVQAPAAARPLVKARISERVASNTAAAKLDLSGKFWYLDRDKKLPHLPATLVCTGNCKTPNPQYRATFTGISGIVFGNLVVNSNYVGFGSGPAPAIIGACSTDFTIILENDRAVGNVFAAYAPCGTKFQGGTSIYAIQSGLFATLKRNLMNDVRIWTQVPGKVVGRYNLHDRNVASTNEPLTLTCVADCENLKTPTYKGVFGKQSFTVKFAPDGYAGFGTLDVLKTDGTVCGQTTFTIIVPPKGLADGASFLAAAKPLPACSYAGQALRID